MKTSSTSNSKRAPLGFLTALVVVLVLEAFQIVFAPYFHIEEEDDANIGKLTRYGLLRVETKHRVSLSGDVAAEIVIVGDSGGMVGIDPAVIESTSPYRAINYCPFATDGTIAGYIMLRNHLNTTSLPPKFLVVYFTDLTFMRTKPRGGYEYQYADGDRQTLIADIGIWAWLRAQLPSLRHQATLRKVFKRPSLLRHVDPEGVRAVIDETYDAKGYVAYNRTFGYRSHPPKQLRPESRTRFIEVSPHIEKYFRKIIETGLDAGLRVVLITGVRPQDWYEHDAKASARRYIRALYESFEQDYDELVVLDVQLVVGDESNFVDQYHMNAQGAKLLSEHIAVTIMSLGS